MVVEESWDILKMLLGPLRTLSDWLRLPDYIKTEFRRRIEGSAEFHNEEDFWRAALGIAAYRPSSLKPLSPGTVVSLKGFQITEWVPLNPGQYWTELGFARRESARPYKNLIYFSEKQPMLAYDLEGKIRMMLGGIGTVKLRPLRFPLDTHSYSLLCATSSGHCWSGIPILVSKQVYNKFQATLRQNKRVQADIVGTYQSKPFNPKDMVIAARGVNIPETTEQIITECCGIPQCVVVVDSVLHTKQGVGAFSVKAVAWTLFQGKRKLWDNRKFFSFTYHTFDPQNDISHNIARNFILNYFKYFGGENFVTDYDETRPNFSVFSEREMDEIDIFRKKEQQRRLMEEEEHQKQANQRAEKHKLELQSFIRRKEKEGMYSEGQFKHKKDALKASMLEQEVRMSQEQIPLNLEEKTSPIAINKLGKKFENKFYSPYYGRSLDPILSLTSILDDTIDPRNIQEVMLEIANFTDPKTGIVDQILEKNLGSCNSAPYFDIKGGE